MKDFGKCESTDMIKIGTKEFEISRSYKVVWESASAWGIWQDPLRKQEEQGRSQQRRLDLRIRNL